jgi:hypothetical protein
MGDNGDQFITHRRFHDAQRAEHPGQFDKYWMGILLYCAAVFMLLWALIQRLNNEFHWKIKQVNFGRAQPLAMFLLAC